MLKECQRLDESCAPLSLVITVDGAEWDHDSFPEFAADYRRSRGDSRVMFRGDALAVSVGAYGAYQGSSDGKTAWGWRTRTSVSAASRATIESLFAIFESALSAAKRIPQPAPAKRAKPVLFIGHGRSAQWRDLKDHLHELHGYPVQAFESGARAGHTVRDVLEEMLSTSAFALLVLTAEDELADGTLRARQNVVHEAGLFQGRLGFRNTILLLEEGCEEFSNVQGIQQIRYSKGKIKETFGDVLATLSREFTR